MSFTVQKTAAQIVLCPEYLRDLINENPTIVTVCEDVVVDDGVNCTFTFAGTGPLSGAEDTELQSLIDTFDCDWDVIDNQGTSGLIIRNDGITLVDDTNALDFQGAVAATQGAVAGTGVIHIGHTEVTNNSGVTIPENYPVYITGYDAVNKRAYIAASDASNPAKMPSIGLTETQMLNGETGLVVTVGETHGVDTSSYTVGQQLWVAVGGGLATTRPDGATTLVQKIAQVLYVDAADGKIFVQGAGRTNDVPNLQENYFWKGDASGVATPTLFTATVDPTGLGGWHEVKVFGVDGSAGNRFLQNLGNHMDSKNNGFAAMAAGQIVHVSISVSCKTNGPLNDATIQIVKNACYGGAGDFAGGTQVGANLNKNNNQRSQFFTNLSGYTFAQGDIISVYIKKNPDDLKLPYVRLYVRYN